MRVRGLTSASCGWAGRACAAGGASPSPPALSSSTTRSSQPATGSSTRTRAPVASRTALTPAPPRPSSAGVRLDGTSRRSDTDSAEGAGRLASPSPSASLSGAGRLGALRDAPPSTDTSLSFASAAAAASSSPASPSPSLLSPSRLPIAERRDSGRGRRPAVAPLAVGRSARAPPNADQAPWRAGGHERAQVQARLRPCCRAARAARVYVARGVLRRAAR